MNRVGGVCCTVLVVCSVVGCRKEQVVTFEPNMVYAKSIEIESGYGMQQALDETQVALERFFGTPDVPQLPEFVTSDEEYASLVDLGRVQKAAGPITPDGGGLYRQHCSTCHGVVGNGRGTTAALLEPYPRDYRMGKFKYKSTRRGAKPTREDLAYAIEKGIDGTAMKPIPELSDEDVEALVDYVIYLSWRGEVERSLLMEGGEIDFEDGESLFNPASETFEEQLEFAQDTVLEIADSWLEAPDLVRDVPPPGDIPVPATIEELRTALAADGDTAIKQSVAKGKEVFQSEVAACSKCHGNEGRGDGPQQDYDDWTKEWTSRIGIEPEDTDAQVPLVARGALPPRKIVPRDFREGLFRGGSEPEHIYRRISLGIDGTPMPAATLPPEDIWHLVNFVRSLAEPPKAEESLP
ncbi:MAG: cytochrome c [Planctomycetales bacterium]|nr:cytochrome c [Planctomycetales bacterium]